MPLKGRPSSAGMGHLSSRKRACKSLGTGESTGPTADGGCRSRCAREQQGCNLGRRCVMGVHDYRQDEGQRLSPPTVHASPHPDVTRRRSPRRCQHTARQMRRLLGATAARSEVFSPPQHARLLVVRRVRLRRAEPWWTGRSKSSGQGAHTRGVKHGAPSRIRDH